MLPKLPQVCATMENNGPASDAPGRLDGRIQTVAPKLIAGWAVDLEHPDRPVALEVWVQDRLVWLGIHKIATVLADGAQTGIARQFICVPLRAIPPYLLPTVQVIRASDGTALERSTGLDSRASAWRHKIPPPSPKR